MNVRVLPRRPRPPVSRGRGGAVVNMDDWRNRCGDCGCRIPCDGVFCEECMRRDDTRHGITGDAS